MSHSAAAGALVALAQAKRKARRRGGRRRASEACAAKPETISEAAIRPAGERKQTEKGRS
jgi:hypothetical protein